MYEFRNVRGHIEVFLDGEFQFSADSIGEAKEELQKEKCLEVYVCATA